MSSSPQPAHDTPTSFRDDSNAAPQKPSATPSAASTQSSAAVALNMSWQLLVVLLVPTVGGHLLDTHYKTFPVWTGIGTVLALIGCIMVVRQTLRQLNDIQNRDLKKGRK